jgi:hypothetical protein
MSRRSLTPRLIAVDRATLFSQTVSTVYSGETVSTVKGNDAAQFTAINHGANEEVGWPVFSFNNRGITLTI